MITYATVDNCARRQAAQIFRNFINGKISNDEFEDSMPITKDRAVLAIWETAWVFYDDLKEHRLVGRHTLPSDQKRACVRWLLFLHSDLEYGWPDIRLPGLDPVSRVEPNSWRRAWQRANLQDTLAPKDVDQFLSAGHYKVWPFTSVADYKAALRSRRLLAGRGKTAA